MFNIVNDEIKRCKNINSWVCNCCTIIHSLHFIIHSLYIVDFRLKLDMYSFEYLIFPMKLKRRRDVHCLFVFPHITRQS